MLDIALAFVAGYVAALAWKRLKDVKGDDLFLLFLGGLGLVVLYLTFEILKAV